MSGFLLILLGGWGALVPFVGPYFNFAFTPNQEWFWTNARGWLEVLPGAATVLGGLLLLVSGNRATAMFGGWLTVLAGAWFVVGRALAGPLGIGDVGAPVADTETKRVWLELTYFYGLGALIVFLGALALGRLSVRSARDIAYGQRDVAYEERPVASYADETYADRHRPAEAAAVHRQPAASDEVTEIQPTRGEPTRSEPTRGEPTRGEPTRGGERRGLRGIFGRGRRMAHH